MAGKINLINELKKCFGFNKFKGNQEAIIQNLLDGRDTFVPVSYTHLRAHETCAESRMPSSA